MYVRLALTVVVVFLFGSKTNAQPAIPEVHLEVAVQQRESGKVGSGLHLLDLSCWDRQCSLTSVTLNQCHESGEGKPAFFPKVQRSSTLEGSLSVRAVGNTLVVNETGSDIGGEYVNNFRFEYEVPKKDRAATRLRGFSGGFVKNSAILQKVLTIEYVPLPKRYQVLPLDCGVLLPGVDRE